MLNRLLVLFLLFAYSNVFSQNHDVFSNQISAIKLLVQEQHFNPKPLNDSLSKGVFNLFIENLDVDKRFFLKSDIEMFRADELQLDDYVEEENVEFIDKYISTFKKRVENSKTIVESLKNKSFDYSGKDTLYFSPNEKYQYYKNEEAQIKYWKKRLGYRIILKLIEDDSIIENIKSDFKVLEQKAKPIIIKNELCLLNETLNQNGGVELFVKEAFLNAYTNYQDPNSNFFNVSDKKVFESSVSNNQETFGLTTNKNKNGEIIVTHIIPGSPAFINGKIEKNDIIKSLSSNNTILEVTCVSNEDIIDFTNNEEHKTILFKIKKQNGSIQNIKLTKKETKIEENTINGYIITGEKNVGYIKIPSFYTDLESPNGRGLANDVAKELYKLQKENITGLIIDVRFNGGGSMKEASELSGMFINKGPISIIKYKNGEQFTIRDANRGSLFIKPIVILINNYSASASEFFASIVQDYNRAIIVGSKSYGKANAQVIYPLSQSKKIGFCKLTVEKFYRVTGQSNQSVGVIPDIELPSLYKGFKINEVYQEYALPNDSINVTLKHIPLKQNDLKRVLNNSKQRVKSNESFAVIKKVNDIAVDKILNKDEKYPLTFDDIYKDINRYNNLWAEIESIDNNPTSIKVKNNASTIERLSYNDEEKEVNTEILKNISKDIYIEEAYKILNNYINLNTSN